MGKRLRQLAKISPGEWVLLPQFVVFLLAAGVSLRLVALPRLMSFITLCAEGRWRKCFPLLHGRYEVARLAALVNLAARGTYGQGCCLMRSLLLLWLLKARGEGAELCLGVSKEATTLRGHAWIEMQGRVIGDSEEMIGRFATLLRL
jgi:hypothetical protein